MVEVMRRCGVPAFQPAVFGLTEQHMVQDMVNLAKRHHTLAERFCSEEMTPETQARCEAKEKGIEAELRTLAKRFGLRVHFDGDPRGFTVKLHAPSGEAHNTWGGSEVGYGIGVKWSTPEILDRYDVESIADKVARSVVAPIEKENRELRREISELKRKVSSLEERTEFLDQDDQ